MRKSRFIPVRGYMVELKDTCSRCNHDKFTLKIDEYNSASVRCNKCGAKLKRYFDKETFEKLTVKHGF